MADDKVGLGKCSYVKDDRASNPPVVTGICDPSKYLSMTPVQSTSYLKTEVNYTYCEKPNQLDIRLMALTSGHSAKFR